MPAYMIDSITTVTHKIRKGRHQLLIAPITTAVPTRMEDIITPESWVLGTGYSFWGETTRDGTTVTPNITRDPGTRSDQRRGAAAKGAVTEQSFAASFTSLYTDIAALAKSWHLQQVTAQAAVTVAPPRVAATRAKIGVPDTLIPVRFVIVQQNSTLVPGKTRGLIDVLWFPIATLLGEALTFGGEGERSQAISVELEEDTDGGNSYGYIFEESPV